MFLFITCFCIAAGDENTGSIAECSPSTLRSEGVTCRSFFNEKLEMHYGYQKKDKVRICAVNVQHADGWVGIGPGTEMADAKVVIGYASKVQIHKLDPRDLGEVTTELDAVNLETKVIDNKRVVCATFSIIPDMTLIAAVGAGSAERGNAHSFRVRSLKLGGQTTPIQVWLHIALMVMAFWLCFPAGAIVAVYSAPGFRLGPMYFKTHRAVMSAATVLMLLGLVAIISLTKSVSTRHGMLGVLVAFFAIIQPINAYFRLDKSHPHRRKWEYLHKGLGRLVLFLGLLNTVVGALEYSDLYSGSNIFIGLAAVIGLIALLVYSGLRIQQHQRQEEGPKPADKYEASKRPPGTGNRRREALE